MRWQVIVVLLVFVLIYLLAGAGVFMALEYEHTVTHYTDIKAMSLYTDFQAKYPMVSPDDLEEFTKRIADSVHSGTVFENVTVYGNNWNYEDAVYFCVTVISTIGYGHVFPETVGGKVFCIFYALLGIPVAAALLAGIGGKMCIPITKLHKAKPWCRSSPDKDRWLKSGAVFLTGLALMLLVPAAVFTKTEGWDYVSAVYFTTISLTTIGFGDYVAGAESLSTPLHKILMCMWLLFGLAFLAMIVSEASEIYIRVTTKRVKGGTQDDTEASKEKDEKGEEEKATEGETK